MDGGSPNVRTSGRRTNPSDKYWIAAVGAGCILVLGGLLLSNYLAEHSPSRSVRWWTPIAGFAGSTTDQPIHPYLRERGIASTAATGGKGGQLYVPYSQVEEAHRVLKESPFAERLRLHDVEAGLNRGERWDGSAHWTSVAHFEKAKVDLARLKEALDKEGVEWGLVGSKPIIPGTSYRYTLYAPEVHAERALGVYRTRDSRE